MSRTDTATGKGGGRLTEKPAVPDEDGGIRPNTDQPAPFTGQMQAEDSPEKDEDRKDQQR